MRDWVKAAVVYQVYPRSFMDSNDDGIGDLPGIITKLDYLQDLGINVLWLSPVYASPNDDNGYDISDYYTINPEYGGMDDMKTLIAEAKSRGIRIIMDLVINHTSVEHAWFQASRDPTSEYRDYYIWREGKNGLPPNNWTSFFGGGAWEKDELSGWYYLHLFSKNMPDLNFNHPRVLQEVIRILRFWLDMGIAGFRCDVINLIGKNTLLDGKRRIALTGREHYLSTGGCHEILRRLRAEVFDAYDCFTVGETVLVDTKAANDLCAPDRRELDMVFGFEHMETDQINNKWFKTRFKPHKLFNVLERWQKSVDWNANYLENHDQPRSVSRFGEDGAFRYHSATALATMLFALRGTPFVYMGQEFGMTNGDFTDMSELRDNESILIDGLAKRLHFPPGLRWRIIKATSRDNARTPMQWNTERGAGFTNGSPWLKINANAVDVNAQADEAAERSILRYYRRMIALRKTLPALMEGGFTRIPAPPEVFVFRRDTDRERIIAVCSLSKQARAFFSPLSGEVLIGNYLGTKTVRELRTLLPYEAVLLRV